MKFTLAIPQSDHQKARKEVIKELAPNVTVKGFRKGKAPLEKVEEKLDESGIIERTVNHVFPSAFKAHLAKNKLEPIGDPNVTIVSLEKEKDWEFEVEIAEKPDVVLGDYASKITSLNKSAPTVLPEDKAIKNPAQNQEQRINAILELLIKEVVIEIPRLLIEQEANRRLSTLVKQITDMGLTVDAYLKSQNLTKEQLKQHYELSVETNLKVDFILEAIAHDLHITVSPKELRDQIEAIRDPHEREHIEKSDAHKASLRYSLARNKVIDHLIDL